jgi:hypothetical protein
MKFRFDDYYFLLQGIPVNRKIVYMMEILQKTRPFIMTHGGLLESEDIFGKRMGQYLVKTPIPAVNRIIAY